MRSIIFLILITGILGCNRIEVEEENPTLRKFFRTLVSLECEDTISNSLSLKFRFHEFNPKKMMTNFVIPDSIEDAEFYNAYAERLASIFYIWANEDTTYSLDKLLEGIGCNVEIAEVQLIQLCEKNPALNESFRVIHKSYSENETINKKTITLDSLTKISLAYFDIAGHSEENGIAFHFACGQNPFEFISSNAVELSIGEFCREAIKNPEMMQAFIGITEEVNNSFKKDEQGTKSINKIRQQYEPILYNLLKNNKTLAESLISYYENRKEIEPFVLKD